MPNVRQHATYGFVTRIHVTNHTHNRGHWPTEPRTITTLWLKHDLAITLRLPSAYDRSLFHATSHTARFMAILTTITRWKRPYERGKLKESQIQKQNASVNALHNTTGKEIAYHRQQSTGRKAPELQDNKHNWNHSERNSLTQPQAQGTGTTNKQKN